MMHFNQKRTPTILKYRLLCNNVAHNNMHNIMNSMYVSNLVYDQNYYFGSGPILKPKPKLADTFGKIQ